MLLKPKQSYFEIRLNVTSCFLNILISLHTVFSVDVHQAGQFLRDETPANKGKSLKFQTGTQMPTFSSKEEQNLKPL
jgi:hypothetical protein